MAAGGASTLPHVEASTPPEPPEPPAAVAPRDAIAPMRIRAPVRGNRRLERLIAAVNADDEVKAWWHVASLNATRLGMSDHSWVHVQIVVNIALRLTRLLGRRGVEPATVTDHGLRAGDAEAVVAAAALLHCVGMAVHRADHEAHSLFLAAPKLRDLLAAAGYEDPERAVLAAEALHAIIAHRRKGEPFTLEAGIVRVADALDMAEGRSRVPFQTKRPNIHSLSAAAIESVKIAPGRDKAIRIDVAMTNSAGIFQVDELLATKLRGSGLEEHMEVVARIEAEHERRLVPVLEI